MMATFLLQHRHQREEQTFQRRQAETVADIQSSRPSIPAGDHRYRIPTIGLNPGHLPGTRPELAVQDACYHP
jgi:hypothetical protein